MNLLNLISVTVKTVFAFPVEAHHDNGVSSFWVNSRYHARHESMWSLVKLRGSSSRMKRQPFTALRNGMRLVFYIDIDESELLFWEVKLYINLCEKIFENIRGGSFDLWQKDTFFSAAEEVQRSADIMESAFRTWLREEKEGTRPQFWDDLTRELQMALGTAKWQLEEFERAVRLSYRSRADEITMTRHRQFVSAIEEQISSVEEALRESFDDGKQPLRWVNLDEKECDDLALFLSGTHCSSKSMNDGDAKLGACMSGSPQKRSTRKHSNFSPDRDQTSFGNVSSNKDNSCVVNLDVKQSPRSRDICQPDRMYNTQRTSSSDLDSLVIVIDDTKKQEETSHVGIEATPKEKGVKSHFWRPSNEDSSQAKAGILSYSQLSRMHFFNQFIGRVARTQRQLHVQPIMKITRSIRFMLVFMLAIFLVVPFLVYST